MKRSGMPRPTSCDLSPDTNVFKDNESNEDTEPPHGTNILLAAAWPYSNLQLVQLIQIVHMIKSNVEKAKANFDFCPKSVLLISLRIDSGSLFSTLINFVPAIKSPSRLSRLSKTNSNSKGKIGAVKFLNIHLSWSGGTPVFMSTT